MKYVSIWDTLYEGKNQFILVNSMLRWHIWGLDGIFSGKCETAVLSLCFVFIWLKKRDFLILFLSVSNFQWFFPNFVWIFLNVLDLRTPQEWIKKSILFLKLFLPFTVQIDCSCDLIFFENYHPSALNFISFLAHQNIFFS